MTKNVIGFMLVDAPHSALNNAGNDAGERTENTVRVKTIRRGRDVFPYVSGQAVRFWWRNTLQSKFNWNLSPVERTEKVAFTAANPVEYDDDDVFGYMRAQKEKVKDNKGKEKNKDITVTRVSPLKCSPLLSVCAHQPVSDYGVMARQEGNPVPYEHEFYSTVLKGIFSLDLDNVGVFYSKEKTGYKNMSKALEEIAKGKGAKKEEDKWVMPKDVRERRIKNTISALPYLTGGAKLTPHLTDVTPKLLVMAVINGGNHIFMNLAKEEDGKPTLSFDSLKEVMLDYGDILLTDVYIGRHSGFMDELDADIKALTAEYKQKKPKVIYDSVKKTVDAFVNEIPLFIR